MKAWRFFLVLWVGCGVAHAQWHSIDTTLPHGAVSLPELSRGIQFYNSNGLHCEGGTEDGYAPGAGAETCAPHDLDYNPQDWVVSLSELLRTVQFYNSAGYYACPGSGTEDGYCPGMSSEDPVPDVGVNAALNGWRPFGAGDEWNRPVDGDAVASNSDALIAYYGAGDSLRIDAGITEEYYGIPYVVVPGTQPLVDIAFGTDGADYSDESDLGPMPIPLDAPIEGGSSADPNPASGDRHILVIDRDHRMLYELYNVERIAGGFLCSSSAIWDLAATNNMRPAGWTSADAAGLPIFPGLLKYEEAANDTIDHALRVTVQSVRRAYTYPGNHLGPSTDPNRVAYGQRLRLKATFDETGFTGAALNIVRALKKYGLIVADQGSDFYITGVTNPGWEAVMPQIRMIKGGDLEVLEPTYPVVVP